MLSDERPHFDPVPVFIGPVAGWTGPVLAARSTAAPGAALPADAKAYVGEKADATEDESASGQETNAPAVLNHVVRTPQLTHRPRAGPKPARNASLEGKSPKKPAVEKANALKKDAKSTTSE